MFLYYDSWLLSKCVMSLAVSLSTGSGNTKDKSKIVQMPDTVKQTPAYAN